VLAQIPLAFVGGFVSFLAPCVLSLVPGYLSTLSAVEADRLGQRGTGRRVVLATLPFIAGLTVVFVALGAAAGAAGGSIDQTLFEHIAGFVLVVVGLAFLGLLPYPKRIVAPALLTGARGRNSSALLGGAFAVCAAPCVGPVLAPILALAADRSTAAEGAVLLGVYALGLGVPFLVVGFFFAPAMGAFRWLRDRYRYLQWAGGAVLVALGLLLFFDRFWWLRVYLNRALEWLGLGSL
jgi:cytochrome c-type biogenesis protein